MTATRRLDSNPTTAPRLYLALELGCNHWKLAFSLGSAQPPRHRSISARDTQALEHELALAKRRFGLAPETPVYSCYEAGRDGFWLHRWLTQQQIHNLVVDSSSIEVNRRRRRAKSDGLDAAKLVTMLARYHGGERKVWSVVQVPTPTDEENRQLHRELLDLKDERTRHGNRIQGLLANHGLSMPVIGPTFLEQLQALRLWDGSPVGLELQGRLRREFDRLQGLDRQIKDLENERKKRLRRAETPHVEPMRRLLGLSGIGLNGAWLLVMEVFGWRVVRRRKQLGALAGLTPTPYASGDSTREQGISKAGNRRLRRMLVELAWCWVRWQPESTLTQWFAKRFGGGGPRARKVGIVAVARKLLLALGRYLETGEVPSGARLVDWGRKVNGHKAA
jgi:transposase